MMTTTKPRPPDFSKFSQEQLPIEIQKFKTSLKKWHDEQKSVANMQKEADAGAPPNWRKFNVFTSSVSHISDKKDKFIDPTKQLGYVEDNSSFSFKPTELIKDNSENFSPLISTNGPATLFLNKDMIGPSCIAPIKKKNFKDYLADFNYTYTEKYNFQFIQVNDILQGSLRVGDHSGLGYKKGMKFNKDGLFVSSTVLVSFEKPISTYVKTHTSRYKTKHQLYIELLKLMLLKESYGGFSIEVRVKQIIVMNRITHVVSHLVRPPEEVSSKEIEVEMCDI